MGVSGDLSIFFKATKGIIERSLFDVGLLEELLSRCPATESIQDISNVGGARGEIVGHVVSSAARFSAS